MRAGILQMFMLFSGDKGTTTPLTLKYGHFVMVSALRSVPLVFVFFNTLSERFFSLLIFRERIR